MTHRIGAARYHIRVVNPEGVETGILAAMLDGVPIEADPFRLPLVDDGKAHESSSP